MSGNFAVNSFSQPTPKLLMTENNMMDDKMTPGDLMDDFDYSLTARLSGGGGQTLPPLPSKEPPQTNNPFEVVSKVVSMPIVSNLCSVSEPGFMTKFFDEMGRMRKNVEALTESMIPSLQAPTKPSAPTRKSTPVSSKQTPLPVSKNVTYRRSKNLDNNKVQTFK